LDARALVESVACPDCDLLQQIPTLGPGGRAACVRCGFVLVKVPPGSRDRALALTVAAAITLVTANAFPLMELHVVGRFASTTIAGGAYEMWMQGERMTSVLVAFCALIAPAGYLLFMMTLLIAARCSPIPRWTGEMLRWVGRLQVWSMLEVVMLGILVALIKIAQLAAVDPGIGMYAFGATVLLIPAVMLSFDRWDSWRRIAWMDAEMPAAPAPPGYRSAGEQG
jgi:paraquat-inducible protein A